MKQKINEISLIKNAYNFKSDLYTRYKYAFDRLLPLTDLKFKPNEENPLYIHDEDTEEELSALIDDEMDTLSILIGYAGIGKSTVLRYRFCFNNSAPVFYKEDEKILIFPALFNGSLPEIHKDMPSEEDKNDISKLIKGKLTLRIHSVCSFLEEKFPELKKEFYSLEGKGKFYSYINNTEPSALEHLPERERMDSDVEEKEKKLLYAYEKEEFIYVASKLKYYLEHPSCKCERIIVILDDIEPLSYGYQIELIMQYVRFFDCMKNRLRESGKEYLVNMLISLRPHTYRILKSERGFKSYYVTRVILKENMVRLDQLFKRKVEYYKDKIPKKNKDKWNRAYNILYLLTNKFGLQYSKMIENVAVCNTRDAMEIYQRVLENRVWVQKNMEKKASFIIEEDNFIFNNVTVLRSVACGNSYVYSGKGESIIPNILKNTIDKNYSFLILCIFSLFEIRDENDYRYGYKNKGYKEILDCLCNLFPGYDNLEEDVKFAIEYLFLEKILRKSINDIEEVDTIDKPESLTEASLLYLSPKGFEIWEMLASDSVYFELCREDYYRDYSIDSNCKKSSYELMEENDLGSIYKDLCIILLELLDEEKIFVDYAYNNGTLCKYVYLFGNTSICSRLFMGIKKSIEFSNSLNENVLKSRIRNVEMKISEIETILANI